MQTDAETAARTDRLMAEDHETPALIRALADRHRGVGFDQLALIDPCADAEAFLTFYNPDGSTSAACGNATRCIARMLIEETGTARLRLRTGRGILLADLPLILANDISLVRTAVAVQNQVGDILRLDLAFRPQHGFDQLFRFPLPGDGCQFRSHASAMAPHLVT